MRRFLSSTTARISLSQRLFRRPVWNLVASSCGTTKNQPDVQISAGGISAPGYGSSLTPRALDPIARDSACVSSTSTTRSIEQSSLDGTLLVTPSRELTLDNSQKLNLQVRGLTSFRHFFSPTSTAWLVVLPFELTTAGVTIAFWTDPNIPEPHQSMSASGSQSSCSVSS